MLNWEQMKVKKVMKEVTLCGETQDQDHELTRSLDTQPFFTTMKEQDLYIFFTQQHLEIIANFKNERIWIFGHIC